MDEAKLDAMLKEATAHAYDAEDELWAMFSALIGGLSCPFQATLQGEAVTLVELDGHTTNLQAGVMARVRQGDQERVVPLSDLDAVDPDSASAQWLAVYRYWLAKRG